MDETSVNLHYEMLEFVYEAQTSPADCCFNYIWEKFRSQNREIQNPADELKEIFWREIIPNIVEYELLTEEMLNYFKHENLFLDIHDENFLKTLKCNEPKAGKDFIVYKATDVDDESGRAAVDDEPLTTVAKKTYIGNFGWDTEPENTEDSACIRIKAGQRAPEPEEKEDDSLEKVLSLVLTASLQLNATEQYKQLSLEEMITLLEDGTDLTKPEDLQNLPGGLRALMTNCKYFGSSRDSRIVPQSPATLRRSTRYSTFPDLSTPSDPSDPQKTPLRQNRSSINIPDISSASSAFDPQVASSPMEEGEGSSSSPLADVSNTPGQRVTRSESKPRSKHNTRMGLWMQVLSKQKKRRRDSKSPESE